MIPPARQRELTQAWLAYRAARAQRRRAVAAAVASLRRGWDDPTRDQLVALMRVTIEEMPATQEEVAALIGITQGRVNQFVQVARRLGL